MKRRLGPIVTVLVGAALVAMLVYGLTKQGTSRALDAAVPAGAPIPAIGYSTSTVPA